ncbi:hypothetical protein KEM52_002418, partial [Ascosphaera acerosa]
QLRCFRSTPSNRFADDGPTQGARTVQPIWRPSEASWTSQEPQQTQGQLEQPRRVHYRIAAAASGKSSGVTLEGNVYPFLPDIHDAIGLQRITQDADERRQSRPDSGEDAFFVSRVGVGGARNDAGTRSTTCSRHREGDPDYALAFGVADGVGGWANSGVDPADFSHALCTHIAHAAMGWDPVGRRHSRTVTSTDSGKPSPVISGRRLIQLGYERSLNDSSLLAGGSTASLGIAWGSGELELTNLGDSGSMLFRNAAIHHYSPPQTHDFNTPYQLTVMPPRARSQSTIFGGRPFDDLPNAADVTTWDMRHGDVLLLATDGVFDNLFRSDLLRIVTRRMFATGAWLMESRDNGDEAATAAANLEALTRPGGIDLDALFEGDGDDAIKRQARQPAADLPPALRPSLQSLLALSVLVQAKLAGMDMRRDGPFAREAQRYMPAERWRGGKIDDTTALVVVAVEEGREGREGCTS